MYLFLTVIIKTNYVRYNRRINIVSSIRIPLLNSSVVFIFCTRSIIYYVVIKPNMPTISVINKHLVSSRLFNSDDIYPVAICHARNCCHIRGLPSHSFNFFFFKHQQESLKLLLYFILRVCILIKLNKNVRCCYLMY